MKWFFILLFPIMSFADVKPETFVIQINDRSMNVWAPEKKKLMFSVIVENRSLSDQIGKFIVNGNILKYVSVKSGKSEAVEIENKTDSHVVFVPVSPSFQDVDLIFGKKAYEVPSKE
jgi:hypothetical protein